MRWPTWLKSSGWRDDSRIEQLRMLLGKTLPWMSWGLCTRDWCQCCPLRGFSDYKMHNLSQKRVWQRVELNAGRSCRVGSWAKSQVHWVFGLLCRKQLEKKVQPLLDHWLPGHKSIIHPFSCNFGARIPEEVALYLQGPRMKVATPNSVPHFIMSPY
jgi:hypothetical protein